MSRSKPGIGWELTLEQEAMTWINGAFRSISRALTYVEDALFVVLIQEAIGEGRTRGDDVAWRALELGGWKPKWVRAGEISYIGIDQAWARQGFH